MASWADHASVGDPLGLAVTLQPAVTPFLAAQGEVYTLGQPLSLCCHLEDKALVLHTSQVGTALHCGHWVSTAASFHGQSSHRGLQLPLQKSPQLCSELPAGTGGSDTQTPPCVLSPSQIWLFQTMRLPSNLALLQDSRRQWWGGSRREAESNP